MAHTPNTILQIIPDLDTGGAERTVVATSQAVTLAGGRSLVVSRGGGRLVGELVETGGMLIELDAATKNPLGLWRNAAKLVELIRRENVRLIHAHSRAPAWSARWAARRSGIAFVTTYHGAYNETGRLKRTYNSIMAAGDRVIANSLYTRELVQSRYATSDDRIRVVYCGIDTDQFDPDTVSAERVDAVRARWGVSADHRVVLLAGRLTGWKGQTVLIELTRLLRDGGNLPGDVRIVLAGSDQGRSAYRAELENQISNAGLGDQVLMVGHEADMPAAFAASHLSVVASTEPETFGLSTAESLAMRCPVIATRLGATPEIVRAAPARGPHEENDEITGWLTPPGDVAALARNLAVTLALSEHQLAAIGRRGREDIRSRFAVAHTQRQTLAVYDELLHTSLQQAFDARIGAANPTDPA